MLVIVQVFEYCLAHGDAFCHIIYEPVITLIDHDKGLFGILAVMDIHCNQGLFAGNHLNVENPGDSVTLEIEVEGDDITGVTYQWYEDESDKSSGRGSV